MEFWDLLIIASAVNQTNYRLSSVPLHVHSTSAHETLLPLAPLSPISPPDDLGAVAASLPVVALGFTAAMLRHPHSLWNGACGLFEKVL